jgi:hypothetical protein
VINEARWWKMFWQQVAARDDVRYFISSHCLLLVQTGKRIQLSFPQGEGVGEGGG